MSIIIDFRREDYVIYRNQFVQFFLFFVFGGEERALSLFINKIRLQDDYIQ